MKFEFIARRLKSLPWITPEQGKMLYDLIGVAGANHVLELGFHHGVSTVYMAAALEERNAGGIVTTIDRPAAKALVPNIETLVTELSLDRYVQPVYAHRCYTWELMKLLDKEPRPQFDLIFIDGAHLWKTDALSFFLCDKLLKEGGWMVFDDLSWTIADSSDPDDDAWTLKYSEEEKSTPQIRKVFDLLVKEHPGYGEFREEGGFGFAKKLKADQRSRPKESTVVKPVLVTKEMMAKMVRRPR